ncbi:MAG: hypothetical protein HQK91_04535 [Nitrospirae bacterium]|nr:hypothetical protein [Nitrospirota bacterium]
MSCEYIDFVLSYLVSVITAFCSLNIVIAYGIDNKNKRKVSEYQKKVAVFGFALLSLILTGIENPDSLKVYSYGKPSLLIFSGFFHMFAFNFLLTARSINGDIMLVLMNIFKSEWTPKKGVKR